jgi:hypothetical protein
MLFALLCLALAIAGLAPETPIGRVLKELLIDAPARKLARIRRSHVLIAVSIVAMAAVLILIGGREGMYLVGGYVPEGIAWVAAFDIATYLDVFAVIWLAAATVRLRAVWTFAKTALRRAARGPAWLVSRIAARGRRVRKARPSSRPGNDDDGGWAWAFAAA